MSNKKEVSTQFGTAYGADFEENTWTFLMPDNFKVWAGEFAIVDKTVYEKMLAVLKTIDDCHDVYAPDLGMTNGIFNDVSNAIAAAEGQVV
jgi:hypothetical protein